MFVYIYRLALENILYSVKWLETQTEHALGITGGCWFDLKLGISIIHDKICIPITTFHVKVTNKGNNKSGIGM